jgi:3-oxoacyl-[acyl-carrier protein] reductase
VELKGKTAVVTGGTGGLGRRICHALASKGCNVVVVYNESGDIAEKVAVELRGLGVSAKPVQCDLRDNVQVVRMVSQAHDAFGSVDILVNDAALVKWIPFNDVEALSIEDWDEIMAVNLTGPLYCIKAVAPIMRRQGAGRIVNISSIAGLRPGGSSIAYAVSKAGLIHLTRCMAVSLAPETLVNCIAPGYLEGTRSTTNTNPAYPEHALRAAVLGRPVEKDDVAMQAIAFCESNSTTGQTVAIDSGRFFH